MSGVKLPAIRRGILKGAVATVVAATLLAGGVAPSQATSGTPPPSTGVIAAGSWQSLTPDSLYFASDTSATRVPIGAGPVFGTPQTLLPSYASSVTASAGRALVENGANRVVTLFDRGQKVMTVPGARGILWDGLSGTWYRAEWDKIVSLDGTSSEVGQYHLAFTSGDTHIGSYVSNMYGSLFLVVRTISLVVAIHEEEWGTWEETTMTARQVTVRDAAQSGALVGQTVTVPVPTGADLEDSGQFILSGSDVLGGWGHNASAGSPVKAWVTRTNYVTGSTTTVSLPIPPEIGPDADAYFQGLGDGVAIVQFSFYDYETNTGHNPLYAYNVNSPSQYVLLTEDIGTWFHSVVGNRVLLHSYDSGQYTAHVVELPFGGGSAPHVIGVLGAKPIVSVGSPLNLELDLSKPVNAGTLTIRNASNVTVATLATPASADGSLRGLKWSPGSSPAGTYTWTLNVTDAAGQGAVNTVGNGPASGSFTVKKCTAFTDVPANHTFASSICWVSAAGITVGTGNGSTYSPSNPVNRGSMAAFLYRLAGSPAWTPPAVSPFADVPTTHTFYKAITWLYEQGVTVGTTVGGKVYYYPANVVSRGSMSAFLYRIAGKPAWSKPAVSPFVDVPKSHTFYSSVTWLVDQKITAGVMVGGKLTYQPGNVVNRGSMSAFMQRLTKTYLQCGPYPGAVGC
ncbi:MAG: S-layer homology domain-containing protein [Propionibacteriaceae bacterium]|jgi:hypothetical protein|nr:S-layer homology domain-containing protein [Propionibacteriaceae bacterium]